MKFGVRSDSNSIKSTKGKSILVKKKEKGHMKITKLIQQKIVEDQFMNWVKSGDLHQNYEVFEKIGDDGKIHRNFITRAKSSKGSSFKNNIALNTLSH